MSTGSRRSSRGASKAAPAASPTLRRLELAARLRELRLAAGRSVDEVAAELMCSAAKISRMETAGRGIQLRDVRDLVRFYGLPDSEGNKLMILADEARKPGWWQGYRSLPEAVAHLIGLEAAASDVRTADALLVPGLLQTAAYTTALLAKIRPPGELTPSVLKEWVEARQRRQALLLNPKFHFWSVMDESALARGVGTQEIMIEQLQRLIEAVDLPSVTLQLVPFSKGSYPALEGSFQWMSFGGNQIGDLVFVEGPLGPFFLDKGPEVARYRETHEYIVREVALNPADTRQWLLEYGGRVARRV